MPSSGSGTITPITSTTVPPVGYDFSTILPSGQELGLTLDRYQEIMRLPINAFNGLNRPEDIPQYQCSAIWKQSDRLYILEHLTQAEEMREVELGYALAPKYFGAYEYPYEYCIVSVLTQQCGNSDNIACLTKIN